MKLNTGASSLKVQRGHEPYFFIRMLGAYDPLKLKIIDFVLCSWPRLIILIS